jgi:hypothetical protein
MEAMQSCKQRQCHCPCNSKNSIASNSSMDSETPSVFDINAGLVTSSSSLINIPDPVGYPSALSSFDGTYMSDLADYSLTGNGYQSIGNDMTLTEPTPEASFGFSDPSQPECECPDDLLDEITAENMSLLLSAHYPLAKLSTILSAVNRAMEIVEEEENSRQMTPFSAASNDESRTLQRQDLVEPNCVGVYFGPDRFFAYSNMHADGADSVQTAIETINNTFLSRSDSGSEGSLDDLTNFWPGGDI